MVVSSACLLQISCQSLETQPAPNSNQATNSMQTSTKAEATTGVKPTNKAFITAAAGKAAENKGSAAARPSGSALSFAALEAFGSWDSGIGIAKAFGSLTRKRPANCNLGFGVAGLPAIDKVKNYSFKLVTALIITNI